MNKDNKIILRTMKNRKIHWRGKYSNTGKSMKCTRNDRVMGTVSVWVCVWNGDLEPKTEWAGFDYVPATEIRRAEEWQKSRKL